MFSRFAYSGVLTYLAAKKLLSSIQKPTGKARWEDRVGKGGALTEVKFGNYEFESTVEDLADIVLPPYTSSLMVCGRRVVQLPGEFPNSLFLAGSDWVLGPRGGRMHVKASYFSKELGLPFCVYFTYQNELPFIVGPDNAPPETWEVSITWGDEVPYFKPQDCGVEIPSRGKWVDDEKDAHERGLRYLERFKLPSREDPALLKWRESLCRIEIEMAKGDDWTYSRHRELLDPHRLSLDTDIIDLSSSFSYGGSAELSKGPVNLRSELDRALQTIIANAGYSGYAGSYSAVVAEGWRARESRRKKMAKAKSAKGKQPVLQELGRLTQENGAVSEVKLLVAEEGYTITLDFADEEGYLNFPSTKLFQKTDWICGDE